MLPVTNFERIQICCDDIKQSIEDYSLIFASKPERQCDYKLVNKAGELIDSGQSAWFHMDNTAIELFSSDLRQIKAGIRAVVFAATNMEKTSDQSINGERFYYHYDDSAGSQNQQNVLVLAGREGVAYQILLADPGGRTSDQHIAGDICSVDHLVLSSNDAEACLNLFGDSGLGLRLALDKHAPQWGGRMLFYRSGGMTLEIIISDKPSVHPDRFWGIAYDCADIAASVKRLNEAGVEVSEIRSGRKPNTLVATIKSHTAGVPTLLVEQGEQTPG